MFTMVLQDAKHVGKFTSTNFCDGIPKWIFCDFKACKTKV